jgi:hypothetical protein
MEMSERCSTEKLFGNSFPNDREIMDFLLTRVGTFDIVHSGLSVLRAPPLTKVGQSLKKERSWSPSSCQGSIAIFAAAVVIS